MYTERFAGFRNDFYLRSAPTIALAVVELNNFFVLIFGKVRLLVSFSIGSLSSRRLLLRRPFVSLGQCLVPSHDRAHAAASHFSCTRRNARQVPAPPVELRICIKVPQDRGIFKSIAIAMFQFK